MKTKWSSPENWIIDTKLSPPLMPTKDIRRQRLLEAVTIASDYQLTIIHAPAGYGKTTFLKQWYERHLQADGIASWLSLDEEERNANLFLRYMAAALREAGVSCEALERACDHGVESLPASSVAAITIHILQAFSSLSLEEQSFLLHTSVPVRFSGWPGRWVWELATRVRLDS